VTLSPDDVINLLQWCTCNLADIKNSILGFIISSRDSASTGFCNVHPSLTEYTEYKKKSSYTVALLYISSKASKLRRFCATQSV